MTKGAMAKTRRMVHALSVALELAHQETFEGTAITFNEVSAITVNASRALDAASNIYDRLKIPVLPKHDAEK